MNRQSSFRQRIRAIAVFCTLLSGGFCAVVVFNQEAEASWWRAWRGCPDGPMHGAEVEAGEWYWMRSPEEEKRIIISLYNRYCIRCHGVDGRGVWDIPDVPDFANGRWQASRSDHDLARLTLEGRGACMPAFRGVLTLEQAWAMARYLRTFMPGTEVLRPDRAPPEEGVVIVPAKPRILPKTSNSQVVPYRQDNIPVIWTNR